MLKTLKRTFVISLLCTGLLSCSKQEAAGVDNETQSVIDHSIVQQEYLAIAQAVYHHAVNTPATGAPVTPGPFLCDTLKRLSGDTSSVAYFELDLSKGCDRSFTDGRKRDGRYVVRLKGPLRLAGSRMMIVANAYSVDGMPFGCDSLVLTSISAGPSHAKFSMQLFRGGATVMTSDPLKRVTFDSDMTLDVYPRGLPEGTEALCLVSGSGSGINRNGRRFTVAVPPETPLVRRRSCRFITGGQMELTPEGFRTREIDYGDGSCDDGATYSMSSNTVGFKLK